MCDVIFHDIRFLLFITCLQWPGNLKKYIWMSCSHMSYLHTWVLSTSSKYSALQSIMLPQWWSSTNWLKKHARSNILRRGAASIRYATVNPWKEMVWTMIFISQFEYFDIYIMLLTDSLLSLKNHVVMMLRKTNVLSMK